MDPLDLALDTPRNSIGDFDKIGAVLRLDEMAMSAIAVTEMEAEFDSRRNRCAERRELLEKLRFPIPWRRRKQAFP